MNVESEETGGQANSSGQSHGGHDTGTGGIARRIFFPEVGYSWTGSSGSRSHGVVGRTSITKDSVEVSRNKLQSAIGVCGFGFEFVLYRRYRPKVCWDELKSG